MSVVYDHEHVFWLIAKTFNTTESGGIMEYIEDLEAWGAELLKQSEILSTTRRLVEAQLEELQMEHDDLRVEYHALRSDVRLEKWFACGDES